MTAWLYRSRHSILSVVVAFISTIVLAKVFGVPAWASVISAVGLSVVAGIILRAVER